MQVFTQEKMKSLRKYLEPAGTPFFIFGNKNTYMIPGCIFFDISHHKQN